MIMTTAAFLQTALLGVGALRVGRCPDARQARALSSTLASVACLLAIATLSFATVGGQEVTPWAPLPLLSATVTLLACSLSALARTRPQTYATILALGALSTSVALLSYGVPAALVLSLSFLLTLMELRASCPGTARLFAVYVGASTLLLIVGLTVGGSGTGTLVALAVGLAIRQAGVPFHTWFPRFVEKAPMGLVVAFVGPQLGVLLHLHLLSHHLTPTLEQFIPILGMLTAVYSAILATVQSSLRRTVAYLVISQSGLIAFGLESSSTLGRAGALTAWLLVGIAMSTFAMTVEAAEARHGGFLSLDSTGGDFEATPLLATSFLLSGLSTVGLPGTLGFVAEDLLVQGTIGDFPTLALTLIAVTATNAFTVMRCLHTVIVGPGKGADIDLLPREWRALTLALGLLVLLGLCPWVLAHWFA